MAKISIEGTRELNFPNQEMKPINPSQVEDGFMGCRVPSMSLKLSSVDFMADDTANSRSADGSHGATARKNGTSNGADSRTESSVPVLRRHAGASTEAKQHSSGN
ncbi:hypothetical protein CCP3SC15_340002 [Gammaproteobacteria bacterium]